MHSKKIFFLVILLILLMLSSGNAPGENKQESEKKKKKPGSALHPHEEIVVTATMTRKAVKDCSVSVSLIDETDIKAIAAANAMNLLNHQPSIFVQKTGYFGRADVNIRGLGQRGQRIVILVDGRPEKMGLFGCGVTHAFPLDNVERIEVVRGPSSVLYGSDAIGGVVNIITHMPRQKSETDFSASYGSFNTQQINLRQGGRFDKFSYYFTLDRRRSDGHRENSGYEGKAFSGKAAYDLSNYFQISLQGKYFDGKKNEAGSIDFPLYDFWNDYVRGAVDFSLKGKGEKDEILLKVYRNFGHHRFSDGWHSRDYINGGLVRYTTHKLANNELTLGLDFRILGGRSYDWPKGSWDKKEAAVFLNDEYIIWKKLILSAGLRIHRDSLYGTEVCPRWGIVFQASEETSLRAAINKGFRSPQLNELYMYPAANPELKPEIAWNYEVGIEQKIARRFVLKGTFYRMKGFHFIETKPNPAPPPSFKFMNTGEFLFKGMELGFQAYLSSHLFGHFFYTYLDQGEKTRGRPGQKLDISLRIQKEAFYTSFQAQYVTDYFAADFSSRRLPSYFLLDWRLSVEVSRFFELFLDVNNIFNKDYLVYVDLPGLAEGPYPMPGRSLNLGLRIK